jgi:hydrogenase maturation protein HypF
LKKKVEPKIAVGGHLKNTIAVAKENLVFLSQHIGDLETENSITTLQHTLADFQTMYEITPKIIVHDKHPDYVSTHYAKSLEGPKQAVQHHLAHVLSCMADNELEPPVLGVAWDGTGYGDDGTMWGGEFFQIEKDEHERVGHFRPFALPGGDKAIKRPYRSAIGLLYEMNQTGLQKYQQLPMFHHCDHAELKTLTGMLEKNINSPRSSSAGRLFDAVASILDIQHINHFEGQAPMRLEFAAWQAEPTDDFWPYDLISENGKLVYNWQPTIEAILYARHSIPIPVHSARFHNTLVQVILAAAHKIGQQKVVLSGGTFQNKYLVEKTILVLTREGFDVYTHQQVPPNDGGIALGQIVSQSIFNF